MNQNNTLGKVPPQAIDVEESILGAIMLEKEAIYNISSVITSNDFYSEKNKIIYEACIDLFNASQPIDIKTVSHKLRHLGKLEAIGGAYYIAELTTKVNSAANIETHALIVREQAIKREIIRLSSELQREAYEDVIDVFQLIDKADNSIYKLQAGSISADFVSTKTSIPDVIQEMEQSKRMLVENKTIGSPSGIRALDQVTSGWKPSDLVIVAARPGMGKTAFVITSMVNMALSGIPSGILSMEMSTNQITQRAISTISEVELSKITNGTYQQFEMAQIANKASKLCNDLIIIDDSPALRIVEIKSKARMMVKKYGIKVLFVDYLQLARDPSGGNREQEISRISAALKAIAKDLSICVIALSQLSRAVETRGGDKRPQLSDLRDSGSIEQDADMVMFLYRPEYYGFTGENGESLVGLGEFIIAKFRNGNPQTVFAKYIGKYTKWADWGDEFIEEDKKDIFHKEDYNILLSNDQPF